MLRNNNLSPIPFYESLAEQDFRKWYVQGEKFPLRVSANNLIPFFLGTECSASASVLAVELYKCCDEQTLGAGSYDPASFSNAFKCYANPTGTFSDLVLPNITTYINDGYVTIFYTAPAIQLMLPRGFYYIKIIATIDGEQQAFYSELFYAEEPATLSAFSTKIQWYDEDDVELQEGVIPYAHTFGGRYYGNQLYLDTEIGMPEYTFTEEGEERNGRFFPIKQLSEKVYKMTFLAPEYMCDCLRLACQSDVVKITDRLGREYAVEHFEMDVTWLDGGYRGMVECTFETDTVVKKIGKAYGTIVDR